MSINVIYKVQGVPPRCAALNLLLREVTNGWVTDGSPERAVAYVRDTIALAQAAVQPERPTRYDYVGKATVVVLVDDQPHITVTLTPDNKVITSGFKWEGTTKEWERHRSGAFGSIQNRVD